MAGRLGVAGLAVVLALVSLGGFVVLRLERVAAYTPHAPIYIVGDANFTAANGVVGGSGTPADPFRIEGWDIDTSSNHGIWIRDTNASFVVRNVYIHAVGSTFDGVILRDAKNGIVADSLLDTTMTGVSLYSAEGIAVRNNTFIGNLAGVYVRDSANITISANDMSEGILVTSAGVVAERSAGVQIEGNAIHASANQGVGLSHMDYVVIANNTITNNSVGIFAFYSTFVTITNNTLVGNGVFLFGDAVENYASHTIPPDNSVDGLPLLYYRDAAGVSLDGVALGQLIIANSTAVSLANLHVAGIDYGVALAYVDGATITGSTFADLRGAGVRLDATANVTLSGDVFTGDAVGIDAHGVRWLEVEASVFLDTRAGVVIVDGAFLTIANSSFVRNQAGMDVSSGAALRITANDLRESSDWGIQLRFAADVTVSENEFADGTVGMFVSNTLDLSVYHNNFRNNTWHASDAPATPFNRWDSGFPGGGNFWSGYNGPDDCTSVNQKTCPGPDGLGDVPYVVSPGTQDGYPLTGPWSRLYGRSPPAPRMYPARLVGPGLQDVEIAWDPSADDGNGDDDVIGYEVRFGTTYDVTGATYTVLPAAPPGTSYVHVGAGAGDASTYFYQVRAIEGSGRTGGGSAQAGKESRSLTPGWHLLSLPFQQADPSVGTMLQTVAYDVARTYRVFDWNDPWKVWQPGRGGDLTTLEWGEALWVRVVTASDLVEAGLVVRSPAFQIYPGWNLVAYAAMTADTLAASMSELTVVQRVEAFDASSDPYRLRVLQGWETVGPGEAYWILAANGGLWTQG